MIHCSYAVLKTGVHCTYDRLNIQIIYLYMNKHQKKEKKYCIA